MLCALLIVTSNAYAGAFVSDVIFSDEGPPIDGYLGSHGFRRRSGIGRITDVEMICTRV